MARFAVIRRHGPAWNAATPLREQAEWDSHAPFMDGLLADGFVELGGPLGDGSRVLLIVEARDAEEIRDRLDTDPWTRLGLLVIESIDRWDVLLERHPED